MGFSNEYLVEELISEGNLILQSPLTKQRLCFKIISLKSVVPKVQDYSNAFSKVSHKDITKTVQIDDPTVSLLFIRVYLIIINILHKYL